MRFFTVALAALAVGWTQVKGFLKVDRPGLSWAEGTAAGDEIKISLQQPPTEGNSRVYFQGANSRFDRCALDFTKDNWNVPQSLRIVPVDYMETRDQDRMVPIMFTLYNDRPLGHPGHNQTFTFPTQRGRYGMGQCHVTGAALFQTFDNLNEAVPLQAAGTFYLIKSASLTVQAVQELCTAKTTCITKLTIRYGNSMILINAKDKVNQYLKSISKDLNGITLSETRTAHMVMYHIAFNGGSSMRINVDTALHYVDMHFFAGLYLKNRVQGLCGTFDGHAENDMIDANEMIIDRKLVLKELEKAMGPNQLVPNSLIKTLLDAWRVPDAESMVLKGLDCKLAPTTFPIGIPVNECLVPNYDLAKPLPRPLVVINTPNGYNLVDKVDQYLVPAAGPASCDIVLPPADTSTRPPTTDVDAASKACAQYVVESDECKNVFPIKPYVDACERSIADYLNPFATYASQNLNYRLTCALTKLSATREPDARVSTPAAQSVFTMKCGNVKCMEGCYHCADFGCLQCENPMYVWRQGRCQPKIELNLSTTYFQDHSSTDLKAIDQNQGDNAYQSMGDFTINSKSVIELPEGAAMTAASAIVQAPGKSNDPSLTNTSYAAAGCAFAITNVVGVLIALVLVVYA
jgi:hypothetical protein